MDVKGPSVLRVVPPSAPAMVPDNPEADPLAASHGGYIPRGTRITKADLAEHRYTTGCPACLAARLDDGIKLGNHTDGCKARLERLMGHDRVQKSKDLIDA